ncbi:MAG: putative selenoprotein [Paludibacterium sp.]|uniref:CstA-like transporter-associated (seleno)protein n=1 Tax=Paludibacterium sp. TaxID=1917523 RepID=UPI0025FE4FAE|nr:CstA-like transporter-associated (seleno)protein [Paludibacterium sp.]MBV8045669.1 putative selenoprotein [Paludibacterium sp.]
MAEHWLGWWRQWSAAARLLVGVPDYEAYLVRRRRYRADAPVLSRGEFVRYCAERRLGGRRSGGCC